jgi:thioredoxin 1
MLVNVTDASFEEQVLKSETPVLVDFWAGWCGPCRAIAPVLEAIASENDNIKIVKLDIEANPQTVEEYDITSIPTMKLFVDGGIAKTIVGAKPKGAMLVELADYL